MSIILSSAVTAYRERLRSFLYTPTDPRASGKFFTAKWLGVCSLIVIFGYAAALIHSVDWHEWYLNLDGNCTDFAGFYLIGKFSDSGIASQIYDSVGFSKAIAAFVAPGHCLVQGRVPYPPTLFFFAYPLGLMAYPTALAVWLAGTALVYLAAVYAVIPRLAAPIAALAVVPAFQNVLQGHVGFLTGGLMGLALVFMERRPMLAGMFLGLLTFKPQFGILFPLALLASRNWRALLSATATSAIFAAAAAVAFGPATWLSFLHSLGERVMYLSAGAGSTRWQLSTFAVLRVAGANPNIAWTAQLFVTATMAGIVYALWVHPIPYSLKAAALGIAALLASPYSFQYDFCILTIAVAFFVSDGLSRGFLRGERGIMFVGWFALWGVGPFPAFVCTALLVLVIRRALVFSTANTEMQGTSVPTPGPA